MAKVRMGTVGTRVSFVGPVRIKLLNYLVEFSAMKKLFEKSSVLSRDREMVGVLSIKYSCLFWFK